MLDKRDAKKSRRVYIWLGVLVVAMFGFAFSLVPLYNVLCKVTGINGKMYSGATALSQTVEKDRTITIEFVTTLNSNLPLKFYPLVNKLTLHPGENKRVAFFAENDSGHAITIQAVPSISPGNAADYLKKTECFCFTQQSFKKGEAMDMPVIFHIDPDLPKDVKVITLSYTLFAVPQSNQTKPVKETGR